MTARIGGKTGGRRRGSLDKNERTVVNSELAADLLLVYRKLGGVRWLLKFAEDNPKEFLQMGLSRLFPAAAKSDDEQPGSTYNTQINFESNAMEAGRRVAFALAQAAHLQGIDLAPQEAPPMTPQQACRPEPLAPVEDPDPLLSDLDRDLQRWASQIGLSPDEKLVRETRESISNYRGGAGEQPSSGYSQPQAVTKRRTVAQIRRDQLL